MLLMRSSFPNTRNGSAIDRAQLHPPILRPTKAVFDIFYTDFAFGSDFFCQPSHFGHWLKNAGIGPNL